MRRPLTVFAYAEIYRPDRDSNATKPIQTVLPVRLATCSAVAVAACSSMSAAMTSAPAWASRKTSLPRSPPTPVTATTLLLRSRRLESGNAETSSVLTLIVELPTARGRHHGRSGHLRLTSRYQWSWWTTSDIGRRLTGLNERSGKPTGMVTPMWVSAGIPKMFLISGSLVRCKVV